MSKSAASSIELTKVHENVSLEDAEQDLYEIKVKNLPLLLSVKQMGEQLGISRARAYELANQKDFPSVRIGNRILVSTPRLIQWVKQHESK